MMKSKNLWQRRLSLVLLEVFTKDKALQPEIERRVNELENDKEYYVRKAVDAILTDKKIKRKGSVILIR